MPRRVFTRPRPKRFLAGLVKRLRVPKVRGGKEADTSTEIGSIAFNQGTVAISGLPELLIQEFADDLKSLIEKQSFAWAPLSREYAVRKHLLGLDPRILIATGRYVNSIQPVQKPDGSWEVAVPATPLGNGKHTLKDLARWLEYGTRRMPARPHWRPAMNLWKNKSYQAKIALKSGLVRHFRSLGFR